jgi:hypothetical protein
MPADTLWSSDLGMQLPMKRCKSLRLLIIQFPVLLGLLPGFMVGAVRIRTSPWDRKRNDWFIEALDFPIPTSKEY